MKNKVALITGGTKGIGKAVAESLLEQGVRVAITGRKADEADSVAKSLQSESGTQAIGIGCDVRNFQSQEACVEQVLSSFGQLDFVIANAGVGHFAAVDEMSVDSWQATIDTNLTGVFYTTKASVEALKKSQGYLITIASLAGANFFKKGAAYNASKFGLVGFSQAVMLDLRQYGVKVSTIMPGSVSTHFNGNNPSSADDWKIQPEDIGEIVVDLLKMNPRTLPSKVEVRPSQPPSK